jgi:hypothetical protein
MFIPEGYRRHRKWVSIFDKREGELHRLINKDLTKGLLSKYKDNLILLDEMVRSIVIHAFNYSRRDQNDYVFGYGERQIDSILVPALWDIVGVRKGVVFVQYPTERRDPTCIDQKTKPKWGWVDYRVNDGGTIYALEIKLIPSKPELTTNRAKIRREWENAISELEKINDSGPIGKLGMADDAIFLTAILFIPIFDSKNEKKQLKTKGRSWVHETIYRNLETILEECEPNPKPDWISCWILPKSLQKPWNDDDGKWWQSSVILILAKIYAKWEKKAGSWAPVKD